MGTSTKAFPGRQRVHGLSSSRPGPLKGLPRDQRQNFESKAKTKSEHGNTWHSQGDRKAVHEPRSSRRRKRFLTTFQGQRQKFESRVKTKSVDVCILDRKSKNAGTNPRNNHRSSPRGAGQDASSRSGRRVREC